MIDILRKNKLLGKLEISTLEALLPEIQRVELRDGAQLFKRGDAGDSFYIIESGGIKISTNDVTLNRLAAGDSFGEMALLSDQPRSATAVADPDAALLRLSRGGFTRLLSRHPELADELHDMMQSLMRQSLLATALRRISGEIDDDILRDIIGDFRWETYAAGQVILRQGEAGDDALVIVSGRVQATLSDGEEERVLGEVGSGSIVGELSLLSAAPRSATVTAVRETRVARMSRAALEKIMRTHPQFALHLMETIVQRQQRNFDQNYVEKPTSLNLALVPTHSGIDMADFVEQLRLQLAKHGDVLMIDRRRFDEMYGLDDALQHGHPTSAIVQLWLDELERLYDYVVYVADDEWSGWTSWVVRGADRVLLVGEAGRGPELGRLEEATLGHIYKQRCELVLLHEPQVKQPSGTSRWLEKRDIYRHYHVRKGDDGHVARLARLITGNGIGLVLSGGGARGYAHLGIIKALIEQQVPIDAIGATSMGAVIGGGLMCYMSYDGLRQQAGKLGSRKALLDLTFPTSALMRSKKVSRAMETLYGDADIEDGWLPFFCISTNLSKALVNVHNRGRMKHAVRASLSIPGVFSPVVRDGDLVVDGGVMNNYPVDVMREVLQGGTIIGSLVSSRESKGRPYELDDHIDGWRTFFAGLIPGMKRRRVPSIVKVIMGATSVYSNYLLTDFERRTDLLLQTETHPYGTLDFDNHRELAQKGYDAHAETITAWARAHADLIDQPPMWPPVSAKDEG